MIRDTPRVNSTPTGTMMPSTMGLGATGDPSQAKAAGNLIGEELAAFISEQLK